MYNDEVYDDLDEDIKTREALIEEAKALDTSLSWNDVSKDISNLKRRWKQIQYWDSEFEDRLAETFDSYIDVFYAKRREGLANTQAVKEDLIKQAQELSLSNNFNEATTAMNDLMTQWKEAGNAGKELDDELWSSFNEARQTFFERKNQHWENMNTRREEARVTKKALIEEAIALQDSEEWNTTSVQYRDMMKRWKEAGNAGREFDDDLWNAFQENRQKFYDRREAYYESIRDVQASVYEVKHALLEEAKEIESRKQYTRENTAFMKELNVKWKQAGSCGKEQDDQIWSKFRSVMDDYFAGLKQFNEEKHATWMKNMMDARNRKQEMINTQRRQIKFMQDEIVGLIGERAILDMEDDIAEKEDFIKQLEAELVDIDAKLQQK